MHLNQSTAENRALARHLAIAPSKDTVLHKNLKNKKLGPVPIAVGADVDETAIIDPTAKVGVAVIEADVSVGKCSAVGNRAIVQKSAELGDETRVMFGSIVGPNAILEKGVWVGNDVLIGEGATIGEGARVGSDCEILPGANVEPGAQIHKNKPHPAKA